MKLDILAFGAHPDDVELGCAGTILKEVSLGKKVGIVDLTRGELGTRGTAETRDQEATAAAPHQATARRTLTGLTLPAAGRRIRIQANKRAFSKKPAVSRRAGFVYCISLRPIRP